MDDVRTPLLVILAGINGAGKSTFYQLSLERLGLPFVNADVIARQEWPTDPASHAYEAAERAREIRSALLRERASFVAETVFSHPSKIQLMEEARRAGYRVLLVYIHLQSAELASLRVEERVMRGGHAVPAQKIAERYQRVLAHLRIAVQKADDALLFDNSIVEEPFRHVATLRGGRIVQSGSAPPEWVVRILGATT